MSCTTLVRFSCANVQSKHLCGGPESVHVHTYMSESVRAHVCVCVSVQREYQEISPPKETNRQRNKGTREQHHDTIPRDSTNRHSRQEHPEQREGGETTNHNMNAPQQHPSTQNLLRRGETHKKKERRQTAPHQDRGDKTHPNAHILRWSSSTAQSPQEPLQPTTAQRCDPFPTAKPLSRERITSGLRVSVLATVCV